MISRYELKDCIKGHPIRALVASLCLTSALAPGFIAGYEVGHVSALHNKIAAMEQDMVKDSSTGDSAVSASKVIGIEVLRARAADAEHTEILEWATAAGLLAVGGTVAMGAERLYRRDLQENMISGSYQAYESVHGQPPYTTF